MSIPLTISLQMLGGTRAEVHDDEREAVRDEAGAAVQDGQREAVQDR